MLKILEYAFVLQFSSIEEDELDDEELGHADTFAVYMPSKCKTIQSLICIN